MIISRFIVDNCTYFNLHAEQTFEGTFGSFLNNNIQQAGIFQNTLTKSTIDKIILDLKINIIESEYILFDFKGIEYIQVNQNISFIENILNTLTTYCIQLSNIKTNVVFDLGFQKYIESNNNDFHEINLNFDIRKKNYLPHIKHLKHISIII